MASQVRRVLIVAIGGALIAAGCGSAGGTPASTATAERSVSAASAPAAAPDTTAVPDTTAAPPEVNILTDFGDVCRGVKLPGATPYDATRSGVHPLVTMAGESPEYEGAGSGLPDQWDPVIGQEQTVELVVCLDRVSSKLSQTCGGYKDDSDVDTGKTVEVYDVTYDVRLIAATTGEVIATTELAATDEPCPMLVVFEDGETVKAWYAEPTDALTAWLAPYVET